MSICLKTGSFFSSCCRVFKTIKNGDEYTKTEIAQDSETYNMEHYRRGTVIIFNHYEFDSTRLEIRKGTERDVEALTAVLENLQFEVIICNDYLYDEIYNKIKEGKRGNWCI